MLELREIFSQYRLDIVDLSTAGIAENEMEDELDVDHDDAPLWFRALNKIVGPSRTPGLARRELEEAELYLLAGDEPTTFAEAEQERVWRDAMREEMRSVEQNSTWHLIDLPQGHRPIGLKWVYKVKKDASGAIIRHKARLVAKGYV